MLPLVTPETEPEEINTAPLYIKADNILRYCSNPGKSIEAPDRLSDDEDKFFACLFRMYDANKLPDHELTRSIFAQVRELFNQGKLTEEIWSNVVKYGMQHTFSEIWAAIKASISAPQEQKPAVSRVEATNRFIEKILKIYPDNFHTSLLTPENIENNQRQHNNFHEYLISNLPFIVEEVRAEIFDTMEIDLGSKPFKLLSRIDHEKKRLKVVFYKDLGLQYNDLLFIVINGKEVTGIVVEKYVKTKQQEFNVSIQISADFELPKRNKKFFISARLVCNLTNHLRKYVACAIPLQLSWADDLMAGKLATQNSSSLVENKPESRLNATQAAAVRVALSTDQGMVGIQGPPGTGKTIVAVAILKELAMRKKIILATAPSNQAVLELAKKFIGLHPEIPAVLYLSQTTPIPEDTRLREMHTAIWVKSKIDNLNAIRNDFLNLDPDNLSIKLKKSPGVTIEKEMNEFWHMFLSIINSIKYYIPLFLKNYDLTIVEKDFFLYINLMIHNSDLDQARNLFEHIANFLNDVVMNAAKETAIVSVSTLLNRSLIVFTTLGMCGADDIVNMRQMDGLLVDEAGQTSEVGIIPALHKRPNVCILIGDPRQLGPMCHLKETYSPINISLLERLEKQGNKLFMLRDQYRMHPEISSWPSRQYYQGLLQNSTNASRSDLKYFPPCTFIHLASREAGISSKNNVLEAKFIIDMLLETLYTQLGDEMIARVAVITFYQGQVQFFKDRLVAKPYKDVLVKTVDGYQGSEKDIIIISFVRANDGHKVGFIFENRLNVALTRAKQHLIGVGDSETLMNASKELCQFIEDVRTRNCYIESQDIHTLLALPFKPNQQTLATPMPRSEKRSELSLVPFALPLGAPKDTTVPRRAILQLAPLPKVVAPPFRP